MSDAPRKRKAGSPLPRDLSELAGPSDTGFLAPRPEGAALAALALTEAEVERFTKDGYVATSKPVLTPAQLEQLRADLDELVCPEPPHPRVDLMHELHYNEAEGSGSVLFHGLGHWRCAASFHDLLYLDAVALPASQLLQGRPVRFWHDQAFVKPSGEGAVVQVRSTSSRRPHISIYICLTTHAAPVPRLTTRTAVAFAVAPGLLLLYLDLRLELQASRRASAPHAIGPHLRGPHRADGAPDGAHRPRRPDARERRSAAPRLQPTRRAAASAARPEPRAPPAADAGRRGIDHIAISWDRPRCS